ncbi:MAG TPA: phospholipid carrier-dependent glycosyltransferase [Nitrospiria bacterium]|nr:phospholipid carrier-dependent glycosyltransferase [Nitrospiria bacterium]
MVTARDSTAVSTIVGKHRSVCKKKAAPDHRADGAPSQTAARAAGLSVGIVSVTMTAAVMNTISDLATAWGAALLSVAAIGASAYGFGRWVFARIVVEPDVPSSDRRLFTLAVGTGILALLVLAIGLAGQLYHPVLIGLLLAGAAGWIRRTASPRQAGGATGLQMNRPLLRRIAAGGRLFALVLIIFGVLMPEFFHDALIYHLELSRYDLLHHRIRFLPWNYNSALPANVESLYLLALAFSDERATKLIHAALALLCAAALGALGRLLSPRPESSRLTGLLAGTLFLLTPSVVLLAGVSGNDMGLLFFELTSLLAWWRWRTAAARRQDTATRAPERAWLVISGLLMGFALGSKYSTLSFLIGMAAVWCVWPQPTGMPRVARFRGFGRWLFSAAATASPWWVRNLLATGDPFYPSLGPSAGPLFPSGPGRPFLDENGVAWLRHDLGTGGIDWTVLPDYLLRLASNDIGWLTLTAAVGTAAVILTRRRYAALRPLLWLIAAATAVWWFVSPVPRYLMPMSALLALLGAVGLTELSASGRAARAAAGVALSVGLAAQSIQAAGLIRDNYIAPFTALTGLRALEPGRTAASTWEMAVSLLKLIPDGEARRQWLDWSVPPHAAIDVANRLLPQSAVVLFVGEYRGFYLDRDRIIGTKYDTSPIIRWTEESADAAALAARLRREGVTHLLYNQVEARRLEEEGYPALLWPDRTARERFEQLRREELTLHTVRNGVFLYAVGRAAPPAGP